MKELDKKTLEALYFSKENKEICRELGITEVTLISYVKKLGIKPKGKGYALKGVGNKYRKNKNASTKIKLIFDDEQ